MTTATVVLLPSVEEQRANGDTDIIDPAIVKIGTEPVPVWAGFDYTPENVAGKLTNIRVEDGRLVGDVEAVGRFAGYLDGPTAQFGISGIPRKYHLEHDPGVRVVEELDLLAIGVTTKPPAP